MLTKDLMEEILVRFVIVAVVVCTVLVLWSNFSQKKESATATSVETMIDVEGEVVAYDKSSNTAVVFIESTGDTEELEVGEAYSDILVEFDKVLLSTTYINGEKKQYISALYK